MADQATPPSPTALAPPKVAVEDPGAHELDSSETDDHFSDASEGATSTRPSQTAQGSPIPKTRVEKVDGSPSHGEIPGTDAYAIRTQDAVPDQVEIAVRDSTGPASVPPDSPSVSGEAAIPITVVEKIDPSSASHGDVPGTEASRIRQADAIPDVVRRAPSPADRFAEPHRSRSDSTPGDLPIPITKVSKIDSSPSHGEVPGTEAYELRTEDAQPDVVEEEPKSSPSERNISISRSDSNPSGPRVTAPSNTVSGAIGTTEVHDEDDGNDDGLVEDFDDFEEGEEDEDFGDFDDGFQQGEETTKDESAATTQAEIPSSLPDSSFPILNFDQLKSPADVLIATGPHIERLFPLDEAISSTPVEPLAAENSTFLSDRSLSLWSQLVATPPLQPPNWVRSRIRRLFLVSLGVPVDLDEILPASKQKKLVLPSIHLSSEGARSPGLEADNRAGDAVSRSRAANGSTTSVNSRSPSGARRRRGPPPAPELDVSSATMLCSTTDAALANLTADELQRHIERLEELTRRASEGLEYWLKRKDGAIGDKEAFEGVIENLVKHARKVRK
ncbi:MAG: hypothetical protein M1837_000574 [Sclerophora amabilis]|nr:MAG: hypothetical protein M1837_000574 [Sclerophora amabilis]